MVFLSYARNEKDKKAALKICRDLRRVGILPWIDVGENRNGQNTWLKAEEKIKKCSKFIALISSNFINEIGIAQKELADAIDVQAKFPEDQICIIPVRIDDSKLLNEKLKTLKKVDLFKNYVSGFREIAQTIMPERENINHVLIIEDDPEWQTLLREKMQVEGRKVTVCTDFHEAIMELTGSKMFDLILTDLHFNKGKGLDGLDLITFSKRIKINSIVVTGYSDQKENALNAGVNYFFEKRDLNFNDLLLSAEMLLPFRNK